MSMQKNLKYFAVAAIFGGLIFAANIVSAQNLPGTGGGACGTTGQGICKPVCNPFDEIGSGPASGSGSGPCIASETCCVPTRCNSNNIGLGKCDSVSSCAYGEIGINTSDCVPPRLCCVLSKGGDGAQVGEVSPVGGIQPVSEKENVFTGQTGETSSGDAGGLVPCTGLDCTLCDLLTLIKNIINFLIAASFALAGGFVVWGGIEIMIAGGDEKKVSSGRGRITTAVIGVAIALGSWLFIGTLLQVLTNSPSALPWNKIQCSSKGLQLKNATGTNAACTALGGNCQDKIATCDGTYQTGKCNAPGYTSANIQCCVPKK